MYGNKLAAAIKVNGKVLREFKDTVYIPFGSEYSILVKNLNSVRTVVNIYLDGDNVVPGGLVINPGQEIDLERWIKNGNLSEGNKFKFIERTSAIEDGPRGIKLEDGLIRIEHQFEKIKPVQQWNSQPIFRVQDIFGNTTDWSGMNSTPKTNEFPGVVDRYSKSTGNGSWLQASGATYSANVGGAMRGVDFSNGEAMKASASAAINSVAPQSMNVHDGMATMDWMDMSQTVNDVGITVPGSKSTQKFTETTMGVMEADKHSMVIKLLGESPNNKPVTKPVTVQHKPKCVTCGKQNKAHAKFCTECGTALEIFA